MKNSLLAFTSIHYVIAGIFILDSQGSGHGGNLMFLNVLSQDLTPFHGDPVLLRALTASDLTHMGDVPRSILC